MIKLIITNNIKTSIALYMTLVKLIVIILTISCSYVNIIDISSKNISSKNISGKYISKNNISTNNYSNKNISTNNNNINTRLIR